VIFQTSLCFFTAQAVSLENLGISQAKRDYILILGNFTDYTKFSILQNLDKILRNTKSEILRKFNKILMDVLDVHFENAN
jgi:hypothetical protein